MVNDLFWLICARVTTFTLFLEFATMLLQQIAYNRRLEPQLGKRHHRGDFGNSTRQ